MSSKKMKKKNVKMLECTDIFCYFITERYNFNGHEIYMELLLFLRDYKYYNLNKHSMRSFFHYANGQFRGGNNGLQTGKN